MTAEQPPLHLFCGYAHKDKHLFQQLYTALAVLRRQEAMSIWHDEDLLPGAPWEQEIERELNTADIILLLISPTFMDSDFCYCKEMQWAIARHASGDACVIPIIGKPTAGWKDTSLGKLQALPTHAKPITSWNKRDEAFANVAKGIQKAIHLVNERYHIQKYKITLPIIVYEELHEEWGEYVSTTLPQGATDRRALQWVETVSQGKKCQQIMMPKRKSELSPLEAERTWLLSDQQQLCQMAVGKQVDYGIRHYSTYTRCSQSTQVVLTSQHLPLLGQLLKEGQLPYQSLEWKLDHGLNVAEHVKRIEEQTGHTPDPEYASFSSPERPIVYAAYTFRQFPPSPYNPDGPVIKVTLDGTIASDHAWVGLIYVGPSPEDIQNELPTPTGFYHAHTLFSVQKIMHLLYRKIPHKEMWQLIEKACTP